MGPSLVAVDLGPQADLRPLLFLSDLLSLLARCPSPSSLLAVDIPSQNGY